MIIEETIGQFMCPRCGNIIVYTETDIGYCMTIYHCHCECGNKWTEFVYLEK